MSNMILMVQRYSKKTNGANGRNDEYQNSWHRSFEWFDINIHCLLYKLSICGRQSNKVYFRHFNIVISHSIFRSDSYCWYRNGHISSVRNDSLNNIEIEPREQRYFRGVLFNFECWQTMLMLHTRGRCCTGWSYVFGPTNLLGVRWKNFQQTDFILITDS